MDNQTAGFETAVNSENEVTNLASTAETASEESNPVGTEERQATIESLQEQMNAMQKNLDKREGDYSALNGRYKRAVEEKASLDEINDSLVALTGTTNAMLRHAATQDEDKLTEDLEKVQTEVYDRTNSRSFKTAAADMVRDIVQSVEELGLNLEQSEELRDFREKWSSSYQASDIGGLYSTYAEFLKLARQIERDRRESSLVDAQKSAEDQRRKENEELGINDLDSGVSSPSFGNSNLLTRMGNSETSVSRDEIKQAAEMLRKQGIRI